MTFEALVLVGERADQIALAHGVRNWPNNWDARATAEGFAGDFAETFKPFPVDRGVANPPGPGAQWRRRGPPAEV